MATTTATRRLAAILAADVVGYSRLMGADEEVSGRLSMFIAVCVTLRWREMDSNFPFLVARGCVPFGDGSLPTGLPKATEKGPKPTKP